MRKRRIAVVTTSRADYGIYRPVLRCLVRDPSFDIVLVVSGMHLCAEFGNTVLEIEADEFPIFARIPSLIASDTPEAIGKSLAAGVMGFAQFFAGHPVDILVVLGDRFEMYAAALAALPFRIPVAHLHGGEVTTGAIDDALRHSLTKLAHLHFVATEEYGRRVVQLGEEPWRVTVSGAPALDNLRSFRPLSLAELENRFRVTLRPAPILVTFHPVTLQLEDVSRQADELLGALRDVPKPLVFTLPNADSGGRIIREKISRFIGEVAGASLVENFGTEGYYSLLTHAQLMVGNSSSGIIEAPSFHLPVVNVGIRQEGRIRARNVIDVPDSRREIAAGIQRALSEEFRESLSGLANPYGDGRAGERIAVRLREAVLDERMVVKRFHDLSAS